MAKGVYERKDGDTWPDEAIAILKNNLAAGASFSQIADMMHTAGFEYTRNACISKARRCGFSSQFKPGRQAVRHPREPRMKKPSNLLREEGSRTIDRVPGGKGGYKIKNKPTADELAVARKGHLPAIVEAQPETSEAFMTSDGCKWPTSLEARDMQCCGAEITVGSYCDRHAQMAYRAMPTPKRNALIRKRQDMDRVIDQEVREFMAVGISGPFLGPGSEDETALIEAFIEEHVIDD